MLALTSLLALVPAALAMPSLSERTGPTGTVVQSVITNGKTFYHRGCFDELKGESSIYPVAFLSSHILIAILC
jgi:hypothetical protein